MTLIQVDSFLIEKRYVIVKEERLNNLLLSNTQKWDCFVPRNDGNYGYLFLNRKTIGHCERRTIEAIFCYRIPKNGIASFLAMRVTEVGSFLIVKRYVIAKEKRLNILLLSNTQKGDCFEPRNNVNQS
jgi:hypothetical protein